jgi:hypothetical protein
MNERKPLHGGGGVVKPFFSLSEGVLMASYAAAAYCPPEALSKWTCDRCDGRVAGRGLHSATFQLNLIRV